MEIIYKKVLTFSNENINLICNEIKQCKTRSKNKKEYFDIAAAFDIETSMIPYEDAYVSTMYIWYQRLFLHTHHGLAGNLCSLDRSYSCEQQ